MRNFFICVLCFTTYFTLSSFNGVYLKNYTKQDYKAASQNWSVTSDANGYMYFANHLGLMEFDGITWTLYPAPEGSVIRTVAVDSKNRIFSAGYRELGYWQRDGLGKLQYHSLKKEVEQQFTTNEEFWNVICHKDKVYFQSFSKVYIYDYSNFDVVKPEGFINSISEGGDCMYVNIMNKGIYEIRGKALKPYLIDNFFTNKEIRFILPLSPSQKLIGTSNDGIMSYDGQKLQPWNPDCSDYLRKNIINHGWLTGDGKILIGTILDGLSVFDTRGKLLNHFNKENGLQNNTVLGIMSDRNRQLWLALDNGVDFISFEPDPTYTVFERKELGAVYTAAIYRDKIYLGTNQGMFYRPQTAPGEEHFQLVAGTQGQVWDCKVIDDCLLVNHNKGTFEICGDKVRQLSSVSGGFSILEHPLKPNTLVQSTYSNLIFYKKDNGQWKINHVVHAFNDLIRYLEMDHFGNYWAGHMYRGIFRLKFDNRDSLVYNHYYGEKVFGRDHNIHVFRMAGRIVFTTGEKLYTYDDLKDTIVDYADMNEKLGLYQKATRIVAAQDNRYWLINSEGCALFSIDGLEVKKIREFPNRLFNNQLVIGYENIVPLDGSRAILCLENGYALLNAETNSPASSITAQSPVLRQISISGNNGKNTNLALVQEKIALRYNRNSLQLRFAFPYFSSNPIKYQWIIEGLDKQWSDPMDKPLLSINRLPVGDYLLKVKAVNGWGESSREYAVRLAILPPWYRSMLAYMVYVLATAAGLYLFRRSIIARTREKQKRENEEKERELIRLRNENLQAELSFKSNELASSTMAIIKKNEFLMNMKELIQHQKEELGSRYPDKYYEKLVQKIDENITSQDNWKVFDANFNKTHEQFMKKLKDNYQDLTPSDLRLCAFLRLNLASKEIAPLLGISVRGVENHRYKLRKKLNLEADGNLTDFIIRL
jgi:DNA-binding CsgD family transcriptional regulator